MADMSKFRPPPEPAHTSVVRHFEDLVAILRHLREIQVEIDRAFDEIASQVGFVFTTTVPVSMEIEEGGKVGEVLLRGEHLQGTLFEKRLLPVVQDRLREFRGREEHLRKGRYDFYVIWHDALKLKLGGIAFRPPPEPAHFHIDPQTAGMAFRPPPEPAHTPDFGPRIPVDFADRFSGIIFRPPPEPAHWFDRGSLISELDQVLIVALDEVYADLRLLERINNVRQFS